MTAKRSKPTTYETILNIPAITKVCIIVIGLLALFLAIAFLIAYKTMSPIVISLLALPLVCIFLYWLNERSHYRIAGLTLYFMSSVILTYNICLGQSIYDEAMMAYPLLIIIISLLFGKNVVLPVTTISVIEILLSYFLSQKGIVQPFEGAITIVLDEIITTLIILIFTGFVVFFLVTILEKAVAKLADSENDTLTSYDLTLEAWAHSLELRNREIPGHNKRVTDLTINFSRYLKLDDQSIEDIRRGALLHDIGKMGIPEEILHKSGALTEEEWSVVREHPQKANDFFAAIPYLENAWAVILFHHERVDGTGYPYHLKGKEIPLAGRIFAIIDCWDMLQADRPYSNAWTAEAAQTYLRENAGTQFDAALAIDFLNFIQEEQCIGEVA